MRPGAAGRALLCLVLAACGGGGDPGTEPTASDRAGQPTLQAEVNELRERLMDRIAADSMVQDVLADSADVLIGLRTGLLERMVVEATRSYLTEVRLHLTPDLEVHESDDISLKLGPVRIHAGEWRVRVLIQEIRATLMADSMLLAVADSNRLDIRIPVEARDGSGRALIDFEWDARTATSLICRSFQVSESFAGVVAPRTYQLRGTFVLGTEGDRIMARPYQTGPRLVVSPEPTEEAWMRVREILDRQNNIFRCGLALSPDKLEASLRELLREGFRFRLPDTILKPILLPAALLEDLSLNGREFFVEIQPVTLGLTPAALWYGADVQILPAH